MRKGEIMSFRIGETNVNYQGLLMEIVDYRRMNDIDVRFPDGTIKTTRYEHFKSGKVRCSSATPTVKMLECRKQRKKRLIQMIEDGTVRPFPLSPCYFVDKLGNVYNSNGRKLTPINKGLGYLYYDLPKGDKRHHSILAHRVVAETYIPNPLQKPQVNHINGDKSDNRVENLEWVTSSENQKHRFTHLGHSFRGERNNASKLHDEDIPTIIKLRNVGLTNREIAKEYNVSIPTISEIYNGRRWVHVSYDPTNVKRQVLRL